MDEASKENMERIRQLTERVTPFSEMSHLKDAEVKYTARSGECRGIGLLYQKGVAVQMAEMTKGTDLLCHTHEVEMEYLVIYEGELIVNIGSETKILKVGDCVKIEKGTPHNVITNEGCLMIAITIPASKFYPKEKQ
jgi:quercetin dioxygenase-like cupin family protein